MSSPGLTPTPPSSFLSVRLRHRSSFLRSILREPPSSYTSDFGLNQLSLYHKEPTGHLKLTSFLLHENSWGVFQPKPHLLDDQDCGQSQGPSTSKRLYNAPMQAKMEIKIAVSATNNTQHVIASVWKHGEDTYGGTLVGFFTVLKGTSNASEIP